MQRLGHDQRARGLVPDCRPATLPVGPAPRVSLPSPVSEDHFAGCGMLDLAGERQVVLVASGVTHLQLTGELGGVEHRYRDGEGDRGGVAQVDQGVQFRQGAFLAEAAQQ